VAAVTGLAVPALVYVAFNLGDEAAAAWGVVISTDTAFLLGVLALVGPACPAQLRLFLLTLAIADDVGALTVIAFFYTEDLRLAPLGLAVLGLALMVGPALPPRLARPGLPGARPRGVGGDVPLRRPPDPAGVVIALFTPAYPARRDEVEDAARLTRAYQQSPEPGVRPRRRGCRSTGRCRPASGSAALAAVDQLRHRPGVRPRPTPASRSPARPCGTAATSPVTLGVVAGLVLGKLVGILVGTGPGRAGCASARSPPD
jgi:hypothetical protein